MASRFNLFVNLALYFAINLSLSTCNKFVLGAFPYPWLLTALHATFTFIGCFVCLQLKYFKLSKLTRHDNVILFLFSILFTTNIAMSNLSLSLVSLAFHQATRSTTPIFTILIYRLWYNTTYEFAVYLSLFAMSVGITMATYGDYYFTWIGFNLTVFGVLLASVKTIATNRLMTGSLKLHPLELLLRMCPLAAIQSLLWAFTTGETGNTSSIIQSVAGRPTGILLAVNGILAFAQNLCSFHTNKVAGAITITVCANLKQAFTIFLAILMFHTKVGVLNGVGMSTALAGSAYWSWIKVREKENKAIEPVEPTWQSEIKHASQDEEKGSF